MKVQPRTKNTAAVNTYVYEGEDFSDIPIHVSKVDRVFWIAQRCNSRSGTVPTLSCNVLDVKLKIANYGGQVAWEAEMPFARRNPESV